MVTPSQVCNLQCTTAFISCQRGEIGAGGRGGCGPNVGGEGEPNALFPAWVWNFVKAAGYFAGPLFPQSLTCRLIDAKQEARVQANLW